MSSLVKDISKAKNKLDSMESSLGLNQLNSNERHIFRSIIAHCNEHKHCSILTAVSISQRSRSMVYTTKSSPHFFFKVLIKKLCKKGVLKIINSTDDKRSYYLYPTI